MSPHSWRYATSFQWYFNIASTPGYMSAQTTETYMRNGHIQWYQNDNWCEFPDQSDFAMSYLGDGGGLGWGENGKNTVGFGSMDINPECEGAIACTWTKVIANVGQESDTRFSTAELWIYGQAPDKYDVWSVMAHELGHSLGFAHVFDSYDNVMYDQGAHNSVSHERLGRGDANGNNAKY